MGDWVSQRVGRQSLGSTQARPMGYEHSSEQAARFKQLKGQIYI